MFGAFNDVVKQHGSRHRPDTAWHRRYPCCDLPHARIQITNQSDIGTGDADVNADRARLDHLCGDESRPARRSNDDVGLARVSGQLNGAGMAQGDGRVLTIASQQESERPTNRGTSTWR